MSSASHPDIIIIGGGVIGLSSAWELAKRGLRVTLFEQGQCGRESSWAGAGIIRPGNPERANSPESRLRAESHFLWPQWSEQLRSETGIDNGFSRCGGLEVAGTHIDSIESAVHETHSAVGTSLQDEITHWQNEGVRVESLDSSQLRERFSFLHPECTAGYHLPDLCQVRNPRHLKALYSACHARGVTIHEGTPVVGFVRHDDRITSVRTLAGTHSAGQFLIAGGAWSRELLRQAGHELAVEPVHGQIVLLETRPLAFSCVVQSGLRYLVPRADGRILIGSTEEQIGFEKRNTAEGVAGLIAFARQLVPSLAHARFERCWSGLRPHLKGGMPFIGRPEGTSNLCVAAGHFRSGLELSPVTAKRVAEIATAGQGSSLGIGGASRVSHGQRSTFEPDP